MGQNSHAFFFNSLDSIGFVSIDKPPLGLWIQVIFTKILGYTGLALLLPQALASLLSIYLIYRFVSVRFGQNSVFFAALTLSLTPIFVAVSRNNTMDAILIFVLLFAAGQVSLMRLINEQNAGQIAWLIVPAFAVCLYFLTFLFKRKRLKSSTICTLRICSN